MKYIISPVTPISKSVDYNHRAGWALYWGEETGAKVVTSNLMDKFYRTVSNPGTVYVYHGMEFKNSWNFPGGPPHDLGQRLHKFASLGLNIGSRLVSIDETMPNYAALADRLKDSELSYRLRLTAASSKFMLWPTNRPRYVVIGDSHALSLYRAGSRIYRHDGKTLFGALKIGLPNMYEVARPTSKVELVTFYFGNIDLRHHLLRAHHQEDLEDLVSAYVKQVNDTRKAYQVDCEIAELLPPEPPERTIPKTMWYKGSAYCGTLLDRQNVRAKFNTLLRKKFRGPIYKHPETFTEPMSIFHDDGSLRVDVMEKPRSVHIRPGMYRHILEGLSWTCVLD